MRSDTISINSKSGERAGNEKNPIPEAGCDKGYCTDQHDSVSRYLGFGVFVWLSMGLVSVGDWIYLAAGHLLDIYISLRLLLFSWEQSD